MESGREKGAILMISCQFSLYFISVQDHRIHEGLFYLFMLKDFTENGNRVDAFPSRNPSEASSGGWREDEAKKRGTSM